MKIDMQARAVLFVMLAAFSIMPGCGKKKDEPAAPGVAVNPAFIPIGGTPGAPGGCATVSGYGAQTISFYGQLYPSTGIKGILQAYGYGSQSGGFSSTYYRNNVAGDSLTVYISNTPVNGYYSQATAYAVLSLSANTVQAMTGQSGGYGGYPYGGGYPGYPGGGYGNGTIQVCGLQLDNTITATPVTGSGYTGTLIGNSVYVLGQNGGPVTYALYPGVPIAF
ncbi:MAG TPA: hypothetical protein VIH99_02825 [Bdellovibrionota bacterium]